MATMNISLPDWLKAFVDEQVAGRGFGARSEYVRQLIRRDQEGQRLGDLLREGACFPPGPAADALYFENLRERAAGRRPG